ncbi:MAG: hypothetical protein JJ900_01055 [Rhodospirillales bacterium]|nr:hypothetical protein [Rhodospirillales bacterium]MBO6785407.1 hypothetical protein [Rhodospirillales bacterium]
MLAPIIGAVLIVALAVVLIGRTSDGLEKLENISEQEHQTGKTLSDIANQLAVTHAYIHDLLASVDAETKEGELYDESKKLLFDIHDIRDKIEADLITAELVPDEHALATNLLGLLESYRINATNALLMATVDAALTRRVMSDATTQFNILNSSLLELSRLIDERLDKNLATQQTAMLAQVGVFAGLFIAVVIAMLLIGVFLARILTRDLRGLAADLEGLLDHYSPDVSTDGKRRLVVDTLRYAVDRVGDSYTSLERTREELARSNTELRESFATLAEREYALEKVNTELAETVARQDDLIQAQVRAEEARDSALQTAERANAAKSDFLSNMSHELRTPLNAIIGFADMIYAASFGPIGSKYQEYARDISLSGHHLLDLVTDILDISRVEAGKLELNWERVDLQEIFDACETMLRNRAADAGIQLEIELPDVVPHLETDEFRIRQILINLIDNALKFSPRDSVIRVSAARHDDGRLTLSVRDSGIGIAEEDIPRILEKFGQVRNSHQHTHGGVGLGLAITKLLVELLDGEMAISSEVGHGTTVSITFPEHRTFFPPGRGASYC